MLILADSAFGCGALREDTDDIQETRTYPYLYLHLKLVAFVGVLGDTEKCIFYTIFISLFCPQKIKGTR